jgi:tRNA(His) guanylyltransferase
MSYDEFGTRMKQYEKVWTEQYVPVTDILCVRIDGKGFSKFTKGFIKPFDEKLTKSMIETTKELVKQTGANIGYTQSDEISLLFFKTEKQNEHIFGGKTSKINSIVASMASANFNYFIAKNAPILYAGKGLAYFDCRSWGVPTDVEASNVLLWRIQDSRKNSISSLYRWTLGHSSMFNLNGEQMIEKLKSDANVDWNTIPEKYRYGTFVVGKKVNQKLTDDILENIPVDKRPENDMVTRRVFVEETADTFLNETLESRINYIRG